MPSRDCGVVAVATLLFDESEQSIHVVPASAPGPQRERPRAHRYAVSSRFGSEVDAFSYNQGHGLWVPAQGRDDVDRLFGFIKQQHCLQTHFRILATRCARGLQIHRPPKDRGRREDRVRAAPAVPCANIRIKTAHEHTGSAEAIRPSLRDGVTAYFVLSPARPELVCHRRPQEA